MKKNLLILIFAFAAISLQAQVTITGWNFPVNSGPDSLNANVGLTGNLGYDIRFEGTDTTYETIYFAEGATTFAAASKGWDNGANEKFWSVKFKANGYRNFKLSSKQFSSSTEPGPRDFQVQWRLSSGTFADAPGGAITVADNWTTGVISDLPVPIEGQGSSSVYIRWLVTSATGVGGAAVSAQGETRIDDILLTAENATGTREIIYADRISASVSDNGTLSLTSTVPVRGARIYDMSGKTIASVTNPGLSWNTSLRISGPSILLLSVQFNDGEEWYTRRIATR